MVTLLVPSLRETFGTQQRIIHLECLVNQVDGHKPNPMWLKL